MKLNDYVVKADIGEIAHSSGYAQAQNNAHLGAASSRSTFSQRQSIDYRNSVVKSYADSQLAHSRISREAVSSNSMSSLEQIRARRAEGNVSQLSSNRNKFTTVADKNTLVRMRNSGISSGSRNISRDYNNISQSGLAGNYGPSSVSTTNSRASSIVQSFKPSIRPKF